MDSTDDYLRSRMRTGRLRSVDDGARQYVPRPSGIPQSSQDSSSSWVAFPEGMSSSRPVAFANSAPPAQHSVAIQQAPRPQTLPQVSQQVANPPQVAPQLSQPPRQAMPMQQTAVHAVANRGTLRQRVQTVPESLPVQTQQSAQVQLDLRKTSSQPDRSSKDEIASFSEGSAPAGAVSEETKVDRFGGRSGVAGILRKSSQVSGPAAVVDAAAHRAEPALAPQVSSVPRRSQLSAPQTGSEGLTRSQTAQSLVVVGQMSSQTQQTQNEADFWAESAPNPEHEQTLSDVLGYQLAEGDRLSDSPVKRGKIGRFAKFMAFSATAATMFAVGIGISFLQGRPVVEQQQMGPSEQVLGAQTSATPTSSGSQAISLGVANSTGINSALQPYTNQSGANAENGYTRSEATYKGSKLLITRQPIPDSLRGNEQAFQNVAQQLGANKTFTTKKWGTVYLSSVQAQQVQVLIMKNTDQMVVIQSDRVLAESDWPSYVESL